MLQKILIADDDPISLHLLAVYLREAGFDFVSVQDGQQALELLLQAPKEFNVVIADRIMPHLHGINLLKQMRAHPILKEIPVIMLTGVAEKEEVIDAIKVGVFDFLYKPVEKELLLSVLKRALKK